MEVNFTDQRPNTRVQLARLAVRPVRDLIVGDEPDATGNQGSARFLDEIDNAIQRSDTVEVHEVRVARALGARPTSTATAP